MLTYTSNKYKGGVMLPIPKKKNVTENSLAVPYSNMYTYCNLHIKQTQREGHAAHINEKKCHSKSTGGTLI